MREREVASGQWPEMRATWRNATSNWQPAQSAGHVTKGQCVDVLSEATIR